MRSVRRPSAKLAAAGPGSDSAVAAAERALDPAQAEQAAERRAVVVDDDQPPLARAVELRDHVADALPGAYALLVVARVGARGLGVAGRRGDVVALDGANEPVAVD